MTNPYTFTDNPMVSGVSVCNTDIVNDNIMALKWMHDHISFRSIGEVVTSTIPLVDSGLHLLDGANIESGSYANFVSYIADLYNSGDYPDLFTTESNWQSTVTQYGVCGKFVYDSTNNAVRLPKITGIIEGTTDLTALGALVEAGLPNIVAGTFLHSDDADGTISGACEYTRTTDNNNAKFPNASRSYATQGVSIDASSSNPIYGNSTTVQPQTIKVLYYIVIGTSVKTDIQVDIDEIATDLNGKADVDLSNVPESRGILVEKSDPSIFPRWYRVYADGWCEQGGVQSNMDSTGTGERTISLLKPFTDPNYSVQMSWSNPGTQSSSTAWLGSIRSRSVDSFVINKDNKTYVTEYTWQACGYIR